jgi:REP element-mobilizing transposase RayT
MTQEEFLLSTEAVRLCVKQSICKVCTLRNWSLLALHVRVNHVHAVVRADSVPSRVLNDWKAYSTRALRRSGYIGSERSVWTHGGSVHALRSDEAILSAVRYVLEKQGEPMAVYCL